MFSVVALIVAALVAGLVAWHFFRGSQQSSGIAELRQQAVDAAGSYVNRESAKKQADIEAGRTAAIRDAPAWSREISRRMSEGFLLLCEYGYGDISGLKRSHLLRQSNEYKDSYGSTLAGVLGEPFTVEFYEVDGSSEAAGDRRCHIEWFKRTT